MKISEFIRPVIRIHFILTVIVTIILGAAAFKRPELVFSEQVLAYGPLARNLSIALLYLSIAQLSLLVLRYIKGGHIEALLMGGMFIIIALDSEMYVEVNQIPLSDTFSTIGLYIGFSHILYFLSGRLLAAKAE